MKALLRFFWPVDAMSQRIAELQIEVERLRAENERVNKLLDVRTSNPADHRYWEGRYRDEAATNKQHEHLIISLQAENIRLRDVAANAEMDGPKSTLEKANDAQAARGMARQTKEHFLEYQRAVKVILDRLDTIGAQNHITKEDIRRLRELRKDLSRQLRRSI